jgi:two-component system KDP operon response regulator KdpE
MGSVLIIDDEPDSREAVSRFLTKAGYSVRSAPNGRDALMALATTLPDVIVLDMLMPEMDGVTFLGVVRSYLNWSNLPVIVLTAYPDGPHIDRARDYGVKRIFRKADYRLNDLLACIEELVRNPNAEFKAG